MSSFCSSSFWFSLKLKLKLSIFSLCRISTTWYLLDSTQLGLLAFTWNVVPRTQNCQVELCLRKKLRGSHIDDTMTQWQPCSGNAALEFSRLHWEYLPFDILHCAYCVLRCCPCSSSSPSFVLPAIIGVEDGIMEVRCSVAMMPRDFKGITVL